MTEHKEVAPDITRDHSKNRDNGTASVSPGDVGGGDPDPQEAALDRITALRAKASNNALRNERDRRNAKRAVDAEERAEVADAVAAGIESTWLDRAALDDRPGPEPLVGNLLFRKTLAVLVGPPGSFKSFVAIDWAASVATGKTWLTHATECGAVVYLAGEGDAGLPKRLRAWEEAHNKGTRAEIQVFPMPLALHLPDDARTQAMKDSIIRRKPALVIVDTLNRYTPGMQENGSNEMGLFIKVLSEIKDETGACVLVIHHTTKDGTSERGSTALRGACDTLFMMERHSGAKRTVTLVADRQKEEASGGETKLALEVVNTSRNETSLVIPRVDPFTVEAPPEPPASMPTERSTNLVKLLWNVYVHLEGTVNGRTEAQIRAQVKASPLNLGANEKQRWNDTWKAATQKNLIVQVSGSSRWGLNKALVEEKYGFGPEAEAFYRGLHELGEDPDVEA